MAKYLGLRKKYNLSDLNESATYISLGKLVLFFTETVFGIGAND